MREKLINRMATSGKLIVMEDSSDADAVLSGAVATDIYGRATSASIRLVTRDGHTLWGNEARAHEHYFGGSTSSDIAKDLAKELLAAIARD